jgi:hypothetical protein
MLEKDEQPLEKGENLMPNFSDFIFARETGDFRKALVLIDSLIKIAEDEEDFVKLSEYYNSKRILVKKIANTIKNRNTRVLVCKNEIILSQKILDLYRLHKNFDILNNYYISRFSSELDMAVNVDSSLKYLHLSNSLCSFENIEKSVLAPGIKSSVFSSISRVYYELGYTRKSFESLEIAEDQYHKVNLSSHKMNIYPTLWLSSIYLNYARYLLQEMDIHNASKYFLKLNNMNDPNYIITHRKRLLLLNISKAITLTH